MSRYFPLYNNSSEKIKVELDLSIYTTKKEILLMSILVVMY